MTNRLKMLRGTAAALALSATIAAGALAQTATQSVNPSPMPPGTRAGDAPGMASIGGQSQGQALGTQQAQPSSPGAVPGGTTAMAPTGQPATATQQAQPRSPDAGVPGGTGAAAPSGQPDVARGTAPGAVPGTRPTMTEAQARAQLSGAGYTEVPELVPDERGGWRGRALRNGQQISVAIDPQGQVIATQ